MSLFIHEASKMLVLQDVRDCDSVLGHVKDGVKLSSAAVAIPHNIDNTCKLRALGVEAPSPIGSYYPWPRDRTRVPFPFDNQLQTAGFLTLNKRAFCLSEIGTGKSLSALWAADYLISIGAVRKVLIISPLSTLDFVWGNEIFTHMGLRSCAILHGDADKRRKLFANDAFDFYVINHDGLSIICDLVWGTKRIRQDKADPNSPTYEVKTLKEATLLRNDVDLIIIDEIAVYRNSQTDRFHILKHVIKPEMRVWGLTGTPTPNAPSDAWGQCSLVTPARVPKFFMEFKMMVQAQMSQYVWVDRREAPQIVNKAMQPAIRYLRSECMDLPPCTYSERHVQLTPEQKLHYKAMAQRLAIEVSGGQVTAFNEGVKASKLIQIACGVVYDDDGVERTISCKARIDVVKEIIDQAERKVIIFVPFTSALGMLERALSKDYTIAVVNGQVGLGARGKIFAEFQNLPNPQVLIADARCMSHGLTLTRANTIVWFGPSWSNDVVTQANGRITRSGQTHPQHVIYLVGTEIERRIYERLKMKQSSQGILLELVRAGLL